MKAGLLSKANTTKTPEEDVSSFVCRTPNLTVTQHIVVSELIGQMMATLCGRIMGQAQLIFITRRHPSLFLKRPLKVFSERLVTYLDPWSQISPHSKATLG